MAKTLVFNYTFEPATKTIVVDGNISPKKLLLITNVTDNIILYNFADTTKGLASYSYSYEEDETTFVLDYDTTTMSPADYLQIFVDQPGMEIKPTPTFTDPVSKFRVSTPNTLIDTDFEYGLQSTKWESLERMNEYPAFHTLAGDTPLTNIVDVTVNGTNTVTVTTSSPHNIASGTPIDVRGVDSSTAEGTFIVKRNTDNTFIYEARAIQAGTLTSPVSINTSYVNITTGRFYNTSAVVLDNTASNTNGPVVTNGTNTLTVRTPIDHGFRVGSTFSLVNSLSRSAVSFDPLTFTNGGAVNDRSFYTLSTGNISIFEPYHDGTVRRTVTAASISTVNHNITMTNHGLITGDPVAYVGVSAGGTRPAINAVTGGDFTLLAGNLPQWSLTTTNPTDGMLFAVVTDKDNFRVASNPRDAYNNTNLITFNGTGSGNHDFALFRRGTNIQTNVASFATSNGSSIVTVTISGTTNEPLGIFPEQQITIAGAGVAALNGVYVVRTTNWSKSGTTFEMEGPTNSSGVLVNATATQTYTLVDSGGNGTTSFDRYDIDSTVGCRFVLHTGLEINHTRMSIHDWRSVTAKYWFRQNVNSNNIFIKNHGLTTGQPILYVGGGNTWSGGATNPVDGTIYYVSVVNRDQIQVFTTEGATGAGPYSATATGSQVNFVTPAVPAGGVYQFHPGFTIANFTTATASGGAGTGRDRAIALFNTLPSYITEDAPIVIKAGSGSTVPSGVTNTNDTYTGYQRYFVETIYSANTASPVREFSLALATLGAPVNFTGNATAGAGRFAAFRIVENPFANSFFITNHGGVATNQTTGGSGTQGTYPNGIDYPSPLFDTITDGSGRGWPRVRATLTVTTPPGGLSNGTIYNMIPLTDDIFRLQTFSTTVLPTGSPHVNITSIAAASTTLSFANTSVQGQFGNRIILPLESQTLVENTLVRYENNGGSVDIGSPYTAAPGLINGTTYIVRNVTTEPIYFRLPGTVSTRATSAATTITVADTTRIAIGAYLRINTTTTTPTGEVVLVTNVVGTTVTITRAQLGTTAQAIVAGAKLDRLYSSFQLYSNTQTLPRQFNLANTAANTTTDAWTFTTHGLRAGETVLLNATSTGGTWAGSLNVLYNVIVIDANTFALALSPALAYAQYPIDITAQGTSGTWNFRQFYNAIPLAGLASSTVPTHRLVDIGPTGNLDGGFTVATLPSNSSMTFTSSQTVPTRTLNFNPVFNFFADDGMFYIVNHGLTTGTRVTYTRNALTFAIGEATVAVEGYATLANNTDYFVIAKDANYFQLATTKANALANVPLTRFNSSGSAGNHTITTNQVNGDILTAGLATVVARDIVIDGSSIAAVQPNFDRIVFTSHGFTTGDRVTYQPYAGGTAIQGLVAGRQYFVSNTVFTGATAGGAASGAQANQFSLHNTWVGAYTNTDRVDILGVGTGRVHQFKVTNPTLTGTTFKGEWNTSDTYIYGDVVLFRNAFYMSVAGSTATASFNTGQAPTNDNGRHNVNWMLMPSLPGYTSRFLTLYRAGDTVKLSNTIFRRTLWFDGSSGTRVNTTDNTINWTSAHGLRTGDCVVYRTDAVGSQAGSSDYDNYVNGLPAAPIGGLNPNQIYYVNVLDTLTISLHTTLPDAVRGGSGDTGNFVTAVNLTAVGTGVYHRFEVVEHLYHTMTILAINNDREMVVTDPFPTRSIQFNPQEVTSGITGNAFSIVNTISDEITLPNHGLFTGVKVYYSIGPVNSGTAIGGLTDGTTYYVVRINDNVIRLATNLSNALRGNTIDLTSTGTGFNHFIIAATASGSSWIRFNTSGDVTGGTTFTGTTLFTGQIDGNIRDGVLTALPVVLETQLYARPDCVNVHRPFDGGVEINASRIPGVSIVRQTRKYFRYQSGKGLQYSTGMNFSPSIDVSRITHDGTAYATVITRRQHRLVAGNKIIVENVQFGDKVDADKCARDLDYIISGNGFDVALGTNYNSVFLGNAEVNSLELSPGVVNAITLAKSEVAALPDVADDATALSRSNAFYDEILQIIANGYTASDPVTFTNPSTATVSQIAAKDKIVANRNFIIDEINAWVAVNYPNSPPTHDVLKCSRDVLYVIDGLAYDILYGGNSATYDNARFFFYYAKTGKNGTSSVHKTQTVAAYGRLKSIVGSIVQGTPVTPTAFTLSTVQTTGTGGTFSCAATPALYVGQRVTISGTNSGSGSITGYTDPTSYWIIATNGTTTFTLSSTFNGSAITTTAGTLTGLTFTVGNARVQVTSGNNASSGDATIIQNNIQLIADVVASNTQLQARSLLPTRQTPSVAWAAPALQDAKTDIDDAKTSIINDVVFGAPYTQPAFNGEHFFVFDVIDDFTFRYKTNGIPADLAPAGTPNLFVHSWSDAYVRAGMFDDQNGLFFEYDGETLNCVRRQSTKQLGGLANVTNKSNIVTGVNTNFTKQLEAGDLIVIRGMSYKVTRVVSNTEIQIVPTYKGTTRSKVVITKTEDFKTPQSSWNLDVSDGTGPSGFELNINRMQMAYIDFSWYGAGKVRFGFKGIDGNVFYVHEILHNNREVEAYMRSGNLPARYEIKNGNNPTFAPSLYHWGASVIMDGQFEDDKAYLFTVASGSGGSDTISIPQALAGTPVPVLSMRLAPSVDSSIVGALGERDIINRMSIALAQVGLVVGNSNNRPASVRLILNGALSQQAYFTNYGAPSLTQVIKHTGVASDSITGGVTIFEFRAAVNSPVTADLGEVAEIGNSILGGDFVFPNGPDVITVAVVPTDTTAATTVTARISWRESQA